MSMNQEIKALWLAALRSGEYKQTQGFLQNSKGYCCLGVLCEIQGADRDELMYKTTSVVEPKYRAGLSETLQQHFAIRNDDGRTFKQIANLIEAEA